MLFLSLLTRQVVLFSFTRKQSFIKFYDFIKRVESTMIIIQRAVINTAIVEVIDKVNGRFFTEVLNRFRCYFQYFRYLMGEDVLRQHFRAILKIRCYEY